jgi:integrase
MGRLTALEISRLSEPGVYGDGDNLYLQVRGPKSKSWILRYTIAGKPKYLGLGSLRKLPLAKARVKARGAIAQLGEGLDPLEAKRAAKQQRELEAAKRVTFAECAHQYVAAREATWRNKQHCQQWGSSLARFVLPIIGALPVGSIDTALVLKTIEPMWAKTPETASRVRGRIEVILDWAKSRGYREGENPARWRGHVENLLPARAKLRKVEHHAALPYSELGAFMGELRRDTSIGAKVLQYVVLTAARSGEALGARWDEIDMIGKVWTVPADRMKSGKQHRVPLSDAAVAILEDMASIRQSAFVFPGIRDSRPLSNLAMRNSLKRASRQEITIHGFRSSFRDWCGEQTNFPREIAEAALAHRVGDTVEAAYRRGDALEKRRRLMNTWADYCARPALTGAVIPISTRSV